MVGYAERLRRVYSDRKEKDGLTQVELSRLSGLSQSTISEAMDDEAPKVGVTASVIVRLCMAMEVPTDWVLMGTGDEIPRLARRAARSPSPGGVELLEGAEPIAPPPTAAGAPDATPERTTPKRAARKSASP
jgi:transcriptional regulator with XRE-family HTH domain